MILVDLDFLYTPSRDVAGDMAELVDAFGAQVIFAIDDGGTRVAMLEFTEHPPRILLTDHVDGDRPILVWAAGCSGWCAGCARATPRSRRRPRT